MKIIFLAFFIGNMNISATLASECGEFYFHELMKEAPTQGWATIHYIDSIKEDLESQGMYSSISRAIGWLEVFSAPVLIPLAVGYDLLSPLCHMTHNIGSDIKRWKYGETATLVGILENPDERAILIESEVFGKVLNKLKISSNSTSVLAEALFNAYQHQQAVFCGDQGHRQLKSLNAIISELGQSESFRKDLQEATFSGSL
jgi:hypothetical protein